jgi:hypothetical protein
MRWTGGNSRVSPQFALTEAVIASEATTARRSLSEVVAACQKSAVALAIQAFSAASGACLHYTGSCYFAINLIRALAAQVLAPSREVRTLQWFDKVGV